MHDFECWLLKYNGAIIYGRVYQKGAIKITDSLRVPLLWNHMHNDPTKVLGYAMLEEREEGIYVYGTLYDNAYYNSKKETVIKLIHDRGSISVSPHVFQIKYDGNVITSGVIREVSLVPARIDPDESYYPVLKDKEE